MRAGLPAAEARRQAVLKFGGVEAVKEMYRDQRGLPSLQALLQETRFGLRRLRMAPAFTITTILTLALGIGATTSIFTLVDAVLLSSLPVANPGELYRVGRETHCCYISGYSQDGGFSLVSYDLYKYLRQHTSGFSELAAVPSIEPLFGVRRAGSSEAAQPYPGEFVSGNYFPTFGIKTYAGRALTSDDDRPGAPPVAVISYRLWREKYRADPSVVGGILNVDDKPFTVVGISPPGFSGDTLRGSPPDLFLPLNTQPYVESDADLDKYDTHWLNLIGRIRPGASPPAIEAEMRVSLKQWLRSHWGEMTADDRAKFPQQTLFLSSGAAGVTSMREQYGHWLQILMAMTGFVLLIVCANVANLMLVRGMERRRQTSLSAALGARTSRLVIGPLVESILLSFAGGAAGLAVASVCTRLILHYAFPSLPGVGAVPIDPSPSIPVLLFALVISAVTGVAFGVAPAWIAARVDPIEALRGGSRTTVRTLLPRKMLVVLQTALSLVLLSAAGLLTTVLQTLESRNLGFQTNGRLVATINPRLAGYRPAQLPALYARIRDSIARIRAVNSVALCLYSPPDGGWGSGVWVGGQAAQNAGADNSASWDRVTSGYFDAIGTRVVKGRGISDEDTAGSRKVAVVSEAFARRFFGNVDPVGRHFGREPDRSQEFEVVGVVEDARYWPYTLNGSTRPMFFLAEPQADYGQSNVGSVFLRNVVISTRPGGGVGIPEIQRALASADPNMPVISVRTLSDQVAEQFVQQRLIARLSSLFAVLSVLLASIGLYGVTAYNAGRRVSEIGVRIALGAGRGDVLRLVVRGAFGLILIGITIGLPMTLAAGRFLGTQLYGMRPYDPVMTITAVFVLGVSALVASFIPAFRASRISPLEAVRNE
jgi:predicted permease